MICVIERNRNDHAHDESPVSACEKAEEIVPRKLFGEKI